MSDFLVDQIDFSINDQGLSALRSKNVLTEERERGLRERGREREIENWNPDHRTLFYALREKQTDSHSVREKGSW